MRDAEDEGTDNGKRWGVKRNKLECDALLALMEISIRRLAVWLDSEKKAWGWVGVIFWGGRILEGSISKKRMDVSMKESCSGDSPYCQGRYRY